MHSAAATDVETEQQAEGAARPCRLASAWAVVRRPVIGLAVFSHFLIGLLCFFDSPNALLEVPGVAPVVAFYRRNDFGQTWRMFAPPSQTIDEIGISLKFEGGW